MILILINSLFYIWDKIGNYSEKVESIFMIFYSIEMSLKIIGFGMNAYFKKGWNLIDFSVLVLYFSNKYSMINLNHNEKFPNFGAFRAVRIIKVFPLKSFQIMIFALWNSFVVVSQSLIIFILFVFAFSIIGIQIFSELLKKRCFLSNFGISFENKLCGNFICEKYCFCGKAIENPDHGLTNFDSLFYAFIQVLRIITFDNWTMLMNQYQKVLTNFVFPYFIFVAGVGNYFLNNLILAVIKVKFTDSWNELKEIGLENKGALNETKKIFNFKDIKNGGAIISKFKRNFEIKDKRNASINNFSHSISLCYPIKSKINRKERKYSYYGKKSAPCVLNDKNKLKLKNSLKCNSGIFSFKMYFYVSKLIIFNCKILKIIL